MNIRKPLSLFISFALLTQIADANDAGMQQLFDDIGAYGNVSGPGAYHAQGMNVVTGGNLFMRVPQKNVNLANVQLPSLKMGCGGIDLFAGSFSFISKDQLVSLMKNIGTSAVSYAFKLALDSISPQINKTLTELQQIVQELNSMNINSCEAGEAIARGASGDWQRTSQYFAKVSGPVTGLFSDHSEARAAVQGDNSKVNDTLNSVSDPIAKAMVQPGNIAWKALSKLPGLDDVDRQILMSMTGTVIIPTTQPADKAPTYKPPKSISINVFIRGNQNGKVPVYTCSDGAAADSCLSLADGEVAVTPYAKKIEDKLYTIASKFKSNIRLDNTEIAFVNLTGLPIYKALAVSTALPNSGLDQIWISKYADLIAAEYAFQFIIQSSVQIKTAYASASQGVPDIAQEGFKQMLLDLDKVKSDARDEVRLAYQKVQSVNQIAQEVVYMERNLMANLPSNLAGNLRFASSVR